MSKLYKKHLISATAMSALALGVFIFNPEVTHAEEGTVERIQGNDRYETATLISTQAYKSSETVIIANAMEFADALSGVPLAYEKEAPILLAHGTKLKTATITEIKRLGAKEAIILGGDAAISQSIENELKALGLSVKRLSGDNRYETSAIIADELTKTVPSDKAVVVDGMEFADAMSIAPFAAQAGMPIYLTKTNSLSNAEELKDYSETYIVGGENAVSKLVEEALNSVTRLAGMDRYETNREVIDHFGVVADELYVSTGLNFADALTGSVLAARNNSAVALVRGDVHSKLLDYFIDNPVNAFTILGGEAAVSNRVQDTLTTYIGRKIFTTSIEIVSETGSNEIFRNEELQLRAIIEPEGAENDVYWFSPDRLLPSYSQTLIDKDGLFMSYYPGTFKITANNQDNWNLKDEFTVIVKDRYDVINYKGNSTFIDIPETILFDDVKNINGTQFEVDDISIRSYTNTIIKEGIKGDVTRILNNSFNNKNIKSVKLPNTMLDIGEFAFYDNNIESLILPESVTIIRKEAFSNNRISELKLPTNLNSTGRYTFSNNNLSHLKLNKELETVGTGSFSNNQIETIDFSNKITGIQSYAFQNNLLSDLVFPDNIKSISDHSFENNKITSMKFPRGLVNIGEYAFNNNLIEELILPENIESINTSSFSNNKLKTLDVPSNIVDIGFSAFSNNLLENITFNEGLQVIDGYAFYSNYLEELSLSDSVIEIRKSAFSNNKLRNVNFGSNVSYIGSSAFSFNQIENIILPESLKTIDSFAFVSNNLSEVSIPGSVSTIGDYAFRNNNLQSIVMNTGTTEIGEDAFGSNEELKTITFPSTLKVIREEAFFSTGIEEIVLPSGLETIYHNAFNSNISTTRKLTKISIGDGVEIKDGIIDGTNNFRQAYVKYGAGTYEKNNDNSWRLITSETN